MKLIHFSLLCFRYWFFHNIIFLQFVLVEVNGVSKEVFCIDMRIVFIDISCVRSYHGVVQPFHSQLRNYLATRTLQREQLMVIVDMR